ncbi:SDR family oxidoreductase [Sphingobium sp. TKS]|uniref:SDR family oxidoreductase n=1 Tax=Sphingobium sp. TKS TaxID=1315974 RepID=UPI00076FE961|nr:protein DitG [Sphingobium sp. TKS]
MIIVTGAAGHLGQSVLRKLAAEGHEVAAVDLAGTVPDVGQATSLTGIDLNDVAATTAAFTTLTSSGRVTGLVNLAGGFRWETVGDGSVDSWDLLYRMNLRSAVNAIRAILPALRSGGGVIVNVAAQAAIRAASGMGAYAASKAGVMRLTESLAAEEMDRGVRVNAVMPSIIDTPVNRADMPDADFDRWVAPDALADVVAFLISDAARAITGACIPVTGRS